MAYADINQRKRIQDICKILNITPYQLWKKTDLPKSTFYNLMSKKAKALSIEKMLIICNALSISPNCFVVNDEELKVEVLRSHICSRLSRLSEGDRNKIYTLINQIAEKRRLENPSAD